MNTVVSVDRTARSPAAHSSQVQRPAWLDEALYPFQSKTIDIEGNRIHYVDEGRGPVLLFLHAGPAWSFIYRSFIKALRDQFRCIALDYPGFGLSIGAPSYGYRLRDHARIVEQFILALNLTGITMMVHDSSGSIGLGIAGKHPERFRGLIISDTFAWPLSDYPRVVRMLKLVTSPIFSFVNNTFNLLPWTVAALATRRRKLSPAERAGYLKAFPTRAARQRILTLFRDLYTDETYMRQVEHGLKHKLNHLPALLMYGQNDPARVQGWQTRFEEILPNHRSLVIASEGHFPHEGAPEEMIAAIRTWWKEDVRVPKLEFGNP